MIEAQRLMVLGELGARQLARLKARQEVPE